jgi:NADPH:quinone reductase-like Zn-dependent oxidoreductase
MKYKSVMAARLGGPEVLQVVENDLRDPAPDEVCIKVLAASVSRPDITVRSGEALYSGTPLGQKPPFVPGYSVIGDVDAVGEKIKDVRVGERVGALTVVGGYSEMVYVESDRLIPVPLQLDPARAVPLLLNYIVAYQTMHRVAKAQPGERMLVIGASGGIGTAALQLGKLAGLKMIGLASPAKFSILEQYGATPLDYHDTHFARTLHQMAPDGLDVILDGMMRPEYVRTCLPLLRKGGRMVSFGEPSGFGSLFRILFKMLATNLVPGGKHLKVYGTSSYFLFDKQPYLDDWAKLFRLLQEGKIDPVIQQEFPLLEAAQANALLESGRVIGNLVLVANKLNEAVG